jgi:hypothetical protein
MDPIPLGPVGPIKEVTTCQLIIILQYQLWYPNVAYVFVVPPLLPSLTLISVASNS